MVKILESQAMDPNKWEMVCQNSQNNGILSKEYVNQNSNQKELISKLGNSILSSSDDLGSVKIVVDPNLKKPIELSVSTIGWPCCGQSALKLSIHPLTLLSCNLNQEKMVLEQQLFYTRLSEILSKSPDQLATGHEDMKELNRKYQFILPTGELVGYINEQIIATTAQKTIQKVNAFQTIVATAGALLTMGIGNWVGQDILAEPSWHTWAFFPIFALGVGLKASDAYQGLCGLTSNAIAAVNLQALRLMNPPLERMAKGLLSAPRSAQM